MSKIVIDKKISLRPTPVVIADSTVNIEIRDKVKSYPYEFFSGKIQLMEFSKAYWTVKIRCIKYSIHFSEYLFYLDFEIAEFPEELQKDCSLKFSCANPKFESTIPYASTFSSDEAYSLKLCEDNFTVNLVVLKKTETSFAEIVSGQFVSRNRLLDNISSMHGDENFSDFTFIVKGKEFKVHKLILAASSVMMRKMFTGDYKEKKTGECVIDDIEQEIFGALIRFIYSCTVPEDLSSIVHKLYAAAHYYEVEELKDICLNEIQMSLSAENVMKAYALAFQYDLEVLSAKAWEIIKCDILKIYLPNDVQPLPPNEVAEILALRETEQNLYKKHTKVKSLVEEST